MVAVPADTPVTIPELMPIVAIVVAVLVQVPPPTASVSGVVAPIHTVIIPVMAAGTGLTVTVSTAAQPDGNAEEMMAAPALLPMTTPEELTVATTVLLLLHTPPVVASLKLVVVPVHIYGVPVMATGDGITVMDFVTVQPLPNEYVIVDEPGKMPVTTPVV